MILLLVISLLAVPIILALLTPIRKERELIRGAEPPGDLFAALTCRTVLDRRTLGHALEEEMRVISELGDNELRKLVEEIRRLLERGS